MLPDDSFAPLSPKPRCVGTGLVALDVVINGCAETPPRLWAGGSCGNVLTILSYLGWECHPIARLGADGAAANLLADMQKWGVNTDLAFRRRADATPIVVEKLGTDKNGVTWHRFEWTCPKCGAWLPRYRPIAPKDLELAAEAVSSCHVFYFDRVARSSLELAKRSREHGALVFFEPSSVKSKGLFLKCMEVSDVLKYSHERLGHVEEVATAAPVPLEIESLGAQGLRYRISPRGSARGKWKRLAAYHVSDLKDTTGCGDWCSAGVIHLLARHGSQPVKEIKASAIEAALSFGQALAALKCGHEGARGSMYALSRDGFRAAVKEVLDGNAVSGSPASDDDGRAEQVLKTICPRCCRTE